MLTKQVNGGLGLPEPRGRPDRRSRWGALSAGLLLLAALPACSTRMLTSGEAALLAPLHGAALDAGRVRLTEAPIVGLFPIAYDARPPVTCRERIAPPATGRVETRAAGIALFDRILLAPAVAAPDFAPPRAPLDLASAMFLAHEVTHVWQWQNRARTGYSPLRAFTEQIRADDPYLFALDGRAFLDHGYEQQASLVEEYLCCATLDPGAARTARLQALLSPVLPVAPPAAFPRDVVLPWEGAEVRGICD